MDTPTIQIQREVPDTYNQLRRKIEQKGSDAFAKMLEGVLLQQMIKEMNKTMLSNGMFGKSHQSQMFQGMFTQALADNIAEHGGLGLTDVIEAGLPAKHAAPQNDRKNFKLRDNQLKMFKIQHNKMHALKKTTNTELKEKSR